MNEKNLTTKVNKEKTKKNQNLKEKIFLNVCFYLFSLFFFFFIVSI